MAHQARHTRAPNCAKTPNNQAYSAISTEISARSIGCVRGRTLVCVIALVALTTTGCGKADAAGKDHKSTATGTKSTKGKTAPRTNQQTKQSTQDGWRTLNGQAKRVIEGCGTEPAFSGKFLKHKAKGTYLCGRCDAPLFASTTKFTSGSGWPSFDEALPGAVREVRDGDGSRVEIQCNRCGAHLGHVFRGEGMTSKNTRHCVNSVSLGFKGGAVREAFFAGGCFWGVEYLLESMPGVIDATSGYMGGKLKTPSYKAVTTGKSGHAETVRVRFNPKKVSFEQLARRFFEIHDPTQIDRQGPDRGSQYRSAIFVTDASQRRVVHKLIALLKKQGMKVATKVVEAQKFWPAETYHQDWYKRKGSQPYCHARVKRFQTQKVTRRVKQ